MTSRPSTAAPILAVLAVVLVALGAYVGSYCGLGFRLNWRPTGCVRSYPFRWIAVAFIPAAHVEAWVTGESVDVYYYYKTDDGIHHCSISSENQ
jgi:hypothetical protein